MTITKFQITINRAHIFLDSCKLETFRGGVMEHTNTQRSTVYYSIPDGKGVHVQVCRKTFTEIFDLSHKRVQVLTKKKQLGHTVYVDKRGSAKKPRKYLPELREHVRAHIEAFPVEENHYSRKKSQKKFLRPDLNMNRLYIAFKKKYPETIASYRFFCDTFKKDYPNLRFGRPRSDTCSNCDLYQNKIKNSPSPIDKAQFRQKLELHQRKPECARTVMKEDEVKSQEPTSINSVIKRPDFKDFQKACDSVLNTTKLSIASVCWIQISKECPTKVKTKKTFSNMEDWTVCNVLKKVHKQDFRRQVEKFGRYVELHSS
ncbi:dna-directed rna polymerases i ii and iii subunit rpabc2 [Holotrichia oblita]|uniref:Dna-directed rna polymerases i ii and iii subunit rpabc2 n=1 Tax=Holotrichia oblita TaxID=644536 RepID=A0ACB9TC73_HOLOL|nr:dna-directed rna polymerases i ii and iii subunit rpabc2 [Holotrichia oblita]